MPIPVHALAHRPLTDAAVAELIALPDASVPDDHDAVDAEMERRGWSWGQELVSDSVRTGYGHVLCSDGGNPFDDPAAIRHFLVFGELYPLDPDDEGQVNAPWLYGLMDEWQQLPGWSGRRPSTDQECEAVLAGAAHAVARHLGTPPERVLPSSSAVVLGPTLTQRVWRTSTHALVIGPATDNGPYGYLTHLQLSFTPLTCGPELPHADDEEGLADWITTHVDW